MEQIEERLAPALTLSPNANFTAQLYLDLLNREAAPSEVSGWADRCDQGTPRSVLVNGIEQSSEHYAAIVNEAYETLLLRPADPPALNSWGGYLASGGSESQLRAQITASPEYFATRAGNDSFRFVDALYFDALGRATDTGGMETWVAALAGGANRADVASAIYGGAEASQFRVNWDYNTLLRRNADPSGLATFAGWLQSGVPEWQVRSALASSQEYFVAANTIDPNQRFVQQAYLDILGREADSGGLATWTSLVNDNPAMRSQAALGLLGSQESHAAVVKDLYKQLLGRPGDDAGVAARSALIGQGMTYEQAAADLAGSDEYYFTQGGGTNEGFVTALYADALRRVPDVAGRNNYLQMLASGGSRTQVALSIFTSLEHYQVQVGDYYQHYLHRNADPSGRDGFAGAMSNGMRDEQVIANLVASSEYFHWPMITLTGLSSLTVAPGQTVVIQGSGFDALANAVSVAIKQADPMPPLYVTAYAVTPGSVEFVMPPLADSTGAFATQTVSLQVVEQNGSLILGSNVLAGVTVSPPLAAPAGVAAGAIARAFATTGIDAMQMVKTAALSNSALAGVASAIDVLIADENAHLLPALNAIIANPTTTMTLPTTNAKTYTLDAATLRDLDRMVLSYVDKFVSSMPAAAKVSATPPNTGNAAVDELFRSFEGFHASLASQPLDVRQAAANAEVEWVFGAIGNWAYGALEGFTPMNSLARGDELATAMIAPYFTIYAAVASPSTLPTILSTTLQAISLGKMGQSISTMATSGFPILASLDTAYAVSNEAAKVTGTSDPIVAHISAVPPSGAGGVAAINSTGTIYKIDLPRKSLTQPLVDYTAPPLYQGRIFNNGKSIELTAHQGETAPIRAVLRVYNLGPHGSQLKPQVVSDHPKLVVTDPLAPLVDGAYKDFPISFDPSGMFPGTLPVHLIVSDVNGGPTVTVNVALQVIGNPVFQASMSPDSTVYISKGAAASESRTLTIKNTGPDPSYLSFMYPSSDWDKMVVLSPPQPHGLVWAYALGSQHSMTFQVGFTNTSGLAPGTYTQYFTFSDNAGGAPHKVPLTLVVVGSTPGYAYDGYYTGTFSGIKEYSDGSTAPISGTVTFIVTLNQVQMKAPNSGSGSVLAGGYVSFSSDGSATDYSFTGTIGLLNGQATLTNAPWNAWNFYETNWWTASGTWSARRT